MNASVSRHPLEKYYYVILPPSHFDSPVFLFHLFQIVVHFPIEECSCILIFLKYPYSM